MTLKNKITIFTAICALSLVAAVTHAHEGGHDAPGLVQAPKGGEIKAIEEAYIEVLSQKNEVKIYFYQKDLKPFADLKKFTVSAEAQLPRTKIMTPLTLKESGGSLTTKFDAKGAHRYTLVLKVKDSSHGHDDRLNFTIEPRR